MILKGSRYETAKVFTESAAGQVFNGVRPRDIKPTPGVLEHTVASGERFDALALHYYNSVSRWWRILDANPTISYAGDVFRRENEGTIILIPQARGRSPF